MKIGAIVLIAFSCLTFMLAGLKLYDVFSHPLKFEEDIMTYAKEYDLAPELIASVINVESSFKVNSKSKKNAIGLMQVKLSTANYINDIKNIDHITENDLFHPEVNIRYGCAYLNYLTKKFTSINTVLAAYNAGETIVRSWLNSGVYSLDGKTLSYIPFNETRSYVNKIQKNIKYYSKIFN